MIGRPSYEKLYEYLGSVDASMNDFADETSSEFLPLAWIRSATSSLNSDMICYQKRFEII